MNSTISFYHQNAQTLGEQYLSTSFEEVHQSWKPYWPQAGDKVLDVGAGSGRDSNWFANQGCDVLAIEPADSLRDFGKNNTPASVTWLNDTLPTLKKTENLGMRFDVILLSAVWMHIAPSNRERAFRKLSNLLAPNGKLIISLRFGDFSDERQSHGVDVEVVEKLAKDHALMIRHVSDIDDDALRRDEVTWQTVVLSLPDDGSGDLNKVRHIIVNDSKSATYKLALLRTLLRIADAHSGAILDRSDGKVSIPLGLVALYWIRQFKRLVDVEVDGVQGIQQNSNANKGLGFVKPDGWGKLAHLVADDLAIGAMFIGEDAKALQSTFRDTLKTIKSGPVTYIYQGDKSNPIFQMIAPSERRKATDSFVIDSEFLASFGSFVLDESLWDCFRLYSSWIEPLVVNQWILEMRRFSLNQKRNISLQTYYDCLVWIDRSHDTKDVRNRVDQMRKDNIAIGSVWSGKSLKSEYHVDHCLPFAYWPNNDRWNLLPTTTQENLSKRDRLPTAARLQKSKLRVIEWWENAWFEEQEQTRFFNEAALSLPNIPTQCRDYEEVFEAMGLQVRGVKSRLLVGEW